MHSCVIQKINGSGARLAAASFSGLPDDFVLVLSAYGDVSRTCRVQQRAGNELVVRFVSTSTRHHNSSHARPGPDSEPVFVD